MKSLRNAFYDVTLLAPVMSGVLLAAAPYVSDADPLSDIGLTEREPDTIAFSEFMTALEEGQIVSVTEKGRMVEFETQEGLVKQTRIPEDITPYHAIINEAPDMPYESKHPLSDKDLLIRFLIAAAGLAASASTAYELNQSRQGFPSDKTEYTKIIGFQ